MSSSATRIGRWRRRDRASSLNDRRNRRAPGFCGCARNCRRQSQKACGRQEDLQGTQKTSTREWAQQKDKTLKPRRRPGLERESLRFDTMPLRPGLQGAPAMVTVLFTCPKCQMHCLCGIQSSDDIFALASDLPVRLRCGGCGTESFVVQKPRFRAIPPAVQTRFFGLCLKIAAACRQHAAEAPSAGLREFYLKKELYWLRIGWESDLHQDAVMVTARKTSPSMLLWPRQIA